MSIIQTNIETGVTNDLTKRVSDLEARTEQVQTKVVKLSTQQDKLERPLQVLEGTSVDPAGLKRQRCKRAPTDFHSNQRYLRLRQNPCTLR